MNSFYDFILFNFAFFRLCSLHFAAATVVQLTVYSFAQQSIQQTAYFVGVAYTKPYSVYEFLLHLDLVFTVLRYANCNAFMQTEIKDVSNITKEPIKIKALANDKYFKATSLQTVCSPSVYTLHIETCIQYIEQFNLYMYAVFRCELSRTMSLHSLL